MKKEEMYNGMTGIRSEYLDEADAYKAPKRIHWKRWIAATACICLMMCAAIPLFPGKNISSPFVVTAYAASPDDGSMVQGILEKGKQIPISKVETSSGLVGFMFSHNKQDASAPTIAFMGSVPAYSEQEVKLSEEQVLDIEELLGHASDPTQAYFFFLPGDTAEPYTLPLMLHDEENSKVYQYTIEIVEKDGSYYTEIVEEAAHDYKEHVECETISFLGKTFNKSDLSKETIEWLEQYNALSTEEQLAISYIPADLNKLCGYGEIDAAEVP